MIADALFAPLARWAALTIDGTHPKDPALRKMFHAGTRTAAGVRVDDDSALGYPAYWRAVNIICNGVAKIPCHVHRRLGQSRKERDRRHAAYRLVRRRVNGLEAGALSAGHFRRTLQFHSLQWGNGFAHIDRDAAGRPQELTILLPDRTRLARVKAGGGIPAELDGRLMCQTIIAGQPRFFLPENILHIRGLGFDGLTGYPVLELLKESLGMGLAAREFGARFFGQGASAAGVVTMPEGLDDEAAERFVNSLHAASAGLGKQHKWLVLEEGSKFQQTTIPPEQAQFLQTREFEVREVALIVGIQPHLLGDPTKTSYNSLEQANQNHLDQDLDPWLSTWEEEYEAKLLTEEEKDQESHVIEFNRKALIRTNLAARTAHYASGRQWGYYSANDVRALENLDDIGAQGDVYMVPTNMRPADQEYVETPASAPSAPPEVPTEGGPSEQEQEALRALMADTLRRVARRFGAQARKHAKDPAVYCQWLENGLAANMDVVNAMAEPACAAFAATLGADPRWRVKEFVGALWDALNAACDRCTAEQLPGEVDALAQRFESTEPETFSRRMLCVTPKS